MTAIKITHIPTKLTAYADGRSQHCNKRDAMAILISRLKRKDSLQFTQTANQIRTNQIDDMSRGVMRVRTYNFISNVVIDERIQKKFQPKEILGGNLELIYNLV